MLSRVFRISVAMLLLGYVSRMDDWMAYSSRRLAQLILVGLIT